MGHATGRQMESTLWGAVAGFLSQSVFLDVSRNQALPYPHLSNHERTQCTAPMGQGTEQEGECFKKKYDAQATTKTND